MLRRRGWPLLAFLAVASAPLAGCSEGSFFAPQGLTGQRDAHKVQPPKLPELKTVGTYTSFMGVEPTPVYAVGVVVGLNGAGSNPPPGEMRLQALRLLKTRGVAKPDEYLASGDAAVVAVSALVPPGVRKDEPLDVDVELAPEDKTSDLRGGELLPCDLYEYGDANALTGREGSRMMRHKRLARASGSVTTGPEVNPDSSGRLRKGRVWNGGKSLDERHFALIINRENQEAALAMAVAEAVNQRFHGEFRGSMRGMAEAMNKNTVVLRVQPGYRHNWLRYLRVVRQLPLRTDPLLLQQLQKQYAQELLDPAQTIVAALRLEALGVDAVPMLKQALGSAHPLVRFAAAESLAFLGDPACGEVLAETIRRDPALRALALTALASLDEAVSYVKLRELTQEPDAETRFGAFRALHTLNPNDRLVQGALVNKSFHLHRLAPEATALIHVSTVTRPEIVLFGEEPLLLPPFSLVAGPDFTVTARAGDAHCVVSRISVRHGQAQERCSLHVADVVSTLGQLGAHYGDVLDLMRQASHIECLSCPVAFDALPQVPTIAELAERSTLDGGPALTDLGGTPNLFSKLRAAVAPGSAK
ncbi:MAG TPA: HEAT repeat domain-containing protein [Gemmatales bacterium]|nr:HEAT repeat domain-containing protein [Gemmatales bacterium]